MIDFFDFDCFLEIFKRREEKKRRERKREREE